MTLKKTSWSEKINYKNMHKKSYEGCQTDICYVRFEGLNLF